MLPTRIAVVMTVFNRRNVTLTCLERLSQQSVPQAEIDVYVVDDASPDGTAQAISEKYPYVRLIHGDGELYWNGGMRRAFGAALEEGYDYYLWMNDDTNLDDGALSRLLATAQELHHRLRRPSIVVGSTRHPVSGHITYGGARRTSATRPLHFERVNPGEEPVPAETMNGNCVLIPDEIAQSVGNIDSAYQQKMGDFDYGLRAKAAGASIYVAPGTIGTCAPHPARRSSDKPLMEELRRLVSVKELPTGPWMAFAKRYGGALWFIYFASPYVRRSIRLTVERTRLGSLKRSRHG